MDIAYGDWVNTLKREGVPYDTWVSSVAMPTLSSTASDGTEVANYEGVVVATSGRGPDHRSVDDAADLRAPLQRSPDHRVCGAEQRFGTTYLSRTVGSYAGTTEAPTTPSDAD